MKREILGFTLGVFILSTAGSGLAADFQLTCRVQRTFGEYIFTGTHPEDTGAFNVKLRLIPSRMEYETDLVGGKIGRFPIFKMSQNDVTLESTDIRKTVIDLDDMSYIQIDTQTDGSLVLLRGTCSKG